MYYERIGHNYTCINFKHKLYLEESDIWRMCETQHPTGLGH